MIRTSVDEWSFVTRIDDRQSETLRIERATLICNLHDNTVWTNLADAGIPRDQSCSGDLHSLRRCRQTVDERFVVGVNSLHLVDVLAIGRKGDARLQQEVRSKRVAFGEEEIELVGAAGSQTKRIEIHRPGRGAMNAAEIDNQTVVDEDPDIVVARKLKHFAAAIGEVRM